MRSALADELLVIRTEGLVFLRADNLRKLKTIPTTREERWRLTADLVWGKEKAALTFDLDGESERAAGRRRAPPLPEETAQLVKRFKKLDSGWRVKRAKKILDLPGVGLCVPDLVFTHPDHPKPVYLEVMGFWSRDAVWKRVALVEAGRPDRIIFAVSERLRVSEKVLGDDSSEGSDES